MKAAAEHLTPVILELGGKNPVWIDDTADMYKTARRYTEISIFYFLRINYKLIQFLTRLMYGKTINSGQICISPNYVMCTEKTKTALLKELKDTFKEWYDSNPNESACYSGKMIHNRHFDRLVDMIKNTKGKIEIGGASEPAKRYIEPTVISGMIINSYFQKEKENFCNLTSLLP